MKKLSTASFPDLPFSFLSLAVPIESWLGAWDTSIQVCLGTRLISSIQVRLGLGFVV